MDGIELDLTSLGRNTRRELVIVQHLPSGDAVSRQERRQHMRGVLCESGRVCSGTLACPCFEAVRAMERQLQGEGGQ